MFSSQPCRALDYFLESLLITTTSRTTTLPRRALSKATFRRPPSHSSIRWCCSSYNCVRRADSCQPAQHPTTFCCSTKHGYSFVICEHGSRSSWPASLSGMNGHWIRRRASELGLPHLDICWCSALVIGFMPSPPLLFVEQLLANARTTASPKQRLILVKRLCFVFIPANLRPQWQRCYGV